MRVRFDSRRPWRLLAVAAAVVAVPVLIPEDASAGKATGEHCVVEVTGQQRSGELTTTPMACYSTYEEVLAAEGISVPSDGSRSVVELAQEAARLTDVTIGVHYIDINLGGNSYTVVGADCNGGYLNLPVAPVWWRNVISSTWNGCPRIRHFDGTNLTGSWADTTGTWANLPASMNDRTESIQYLS